MAYCNECGAYIPDGQTECLACGYDEAKKAKETEYNGGYDYQNQQDPIEEEMRRQREEREREERKKEYQQWAREEIKRRQKISEEEKAEKKASERQQSAYKAPKNKSGTDASKIFAALSYLGILFVLPYIFAPNDAYAKYHGKQGLGLFVAGIIADIVGGIFGLGWMATLAKIYLIYKGMMNALNGKVEPLPWIGEIAEK